ncbi:MAG TPA: xanthine dehydrogenase family protein subunit M [Acidimicrobiales bacterium]|nr:xanthine dehydrogenase family protein subunit M [Acidimicrobiales bacterium]
MKPRQFEYHRPRRLDEALGLLAEQGEEAKVIAGGQSLIPMLNFRLAAPAHLVDINAVEELGTLTFTPDGVRIGATVRQHALEQAPDAALSYPLLTSALGQVAHLQIRNRGTVCGSLAHADSAAELPATMVALDATMVARSVRGERRIPAREFFEFHLGTALEADELLTAVEVPASPPRSAGTFVELARRAGDFALVGAAAQASFSEGGRVLAAALSCSGVAPTPLLLEEAAAIATGSALEDEVLMEVDQAVRRAVDPPADVHASASYRRVVAGTLARRALGELRATREAHDG